MPLDLFKDKILKEPLDLFADKTQEKVIDLFADEPKDIIKPTVSEEQPDITADQVYPPLGVGTEPPKPIDLKALGEYGTNIPKEMFGMLARPTTGMVKGLNTLLRDTAGLIGWRDGQEYFGKNVLAGERTIEQLKTPLTDPVSDLGLSLLMGAVGSGLSHTVMAKYIPHMVTSAKAALSSIGTGAIIAGGTDYITNRVLEEIEPMVEKANLSPQVKTMLRITAPLIIGAVADMTLGTYGEMKLRQPELSQTAKHIKSVKPKIKVKKPPPSVADIADDLPKYAGSVNLQRQDISAQAKRIEVEFFNTKGIKTRKSQKELIKKAHRIFENLTEDPVYFNKRVQDIAGGMTPSIEEELAFRLMNANKFEAFVDTAERVARGELPKNVLDDMQKGMQELFFDVTNPLAANAGRRLSMYNIVVAKDKAFKAIAQLNKKLDSRQLEELSKVDWDDIDSVTTFIKRIPKPKLKEYVYEYWYSNVLSGIPTHVVNTVSNTLWRDFQIPHRALTAGIDRVLHTFGKKQRTRYINEVVPLMVGVVRGKRKAIKAAGEIWHQEYYDTATKWGQEAFAASSAFSRSPNKTVRKVGKYFTSPLRAMQAMDVYSKSLAQDAQLGALAIRSALQKGLKGIAKKNFVKEFTANPPDWAMDDIVKYGRYATFTDSPGKISKAVDQLRKSIPGGRLIIPFVNTIGNLLKRGVEMTPGVGLALAKGQNPAEVIAKQIEGLTLGLYVMMKVHNGEITGAAPKNKAARERFYAQGKLPNAWKIGDTYYQYRRIEPFNYPIAFAANAYQAIVDAKDEETATDIMHKVGVEFKNHLIDSSYMEGLARLVNRHDKMKGFVPKTLSSFVPWSSFWRSMDRAFNVMTEGSAKVRDTTTWKGAFGSVIPGLTSPAKIDVWGEDITLSEDVTTWQSKGIEAFKQWLPYKWRKETDDPTEKGLEILEIYPSPPSQRFKYRGKEGKFDEDIYRDLMISYGHHAKKYLDKQFKSPFIKKHMRNKQRHPILQKTFNKQLSRFRNHYRKIAIAKQLKRK